MKFFKHLFNFLFFIFLIIFTFSTAGLFSILSGFWYKYGYLVDTLHHYNWAVFFSRHFPHTNWFHLWGGGAPFIFMYPPTIYFVELAVRTLTNLDMQLIAFAGIFLGFTLAGFWTALAIKIATGSWLLSLIAPLFFLGQSFWGDKNFARGTSTHLLTLIILIFVWYWKNPTKRKKIILILSLGLSTLFQPIIGILIMVTSFCFL
jgi:hypothetical protein